MPSVVYFKFKSNLIQSEIAFEGSAISVNDLKSAIRLKNAMKSNDFDFVFENKDGKAYTEKDLISAYSSVIVRRVPAQNCKPNNKTINPENFNKKDPYQMMRNNEPISIKNINLAMSDMTEDQKEDFVAEYSSKLYNVSIKAHMGAIPPNYLCNKCNVAGHWIKDCPGIADKDGNMLQSRSVKRPSGIPTSNLKEVDSTVQNSYLTTDGRYVVNTKNHDAYLKGKKDKQPFSKEENPPVLEEIVEKPACIVCELCNDILRDPVSTGCCGTEYCRQCALDGLFDDESVFFHKCPHCRQTIDRLDSLKDDGYLANVIRQWRQKTLSTDNLDQIVAMRRKKKTEATVVGAVPAEEAPVSVTLDNGLVDDDDDLTDCLFDQPDSIPEVSVKTEDVVVKVELESREIPVLDARRPDGRPPMEYKREARASDRRCRRSRSRSGHNHGRDRGSYYDRHRRSDMKVYKDEMTVNGDRLPRSTERRRSRDRRRSTEKIEARDGRRTEVFRETKENKDSRERRESKEKRESKEIREAKESKEKRESKERRENKERREAKESKEKRESKERREEKERREAKESKERREVKESKEIRETNEGKPKERNELNENKQLRDRRDIVEPRETKEIDQVKYRREHVTDKEDRRKVTDRRDSNDRSTTKSLGKIVQCKIDGIRRQRQNSDQRVTDRRSRSRSDHRKDRISDRVHQDSSIKEPRHKDMKRKHGPDDGDIPVSHKKSKKSKKSKHSKKSKKSKHKSRCE